MVAPVRWWPLTAADLAHGEELVSTAIRPWLDAWFGSSSRSCIHVKSVRLLDRHDKFRFSASADAFHHGSVLWSSIESGAEQEMAASALDLDLADLRLTLSRTSYCAPFSALGRDIAGELTNALTALAPGATPAGAQHLPCQSRADPLDTGEGGVVVAITGREGTQFAVVILCAALVRAQRTLTSPALASRRKTIEPTREALAATPVTLCARLARIELTLADLLELAPGDVIKLEHGLDALVDVGVAPSEPGLRPSIFTTGRPGRVGNRLSIRIGSNVIGPTS
ncbi:FliM/FliN family flagellar motor C-terminal domain-containing protein [Paraburkholderia sp. J10-1]|uniref:FliM/FliN family flagellar motor C-terminal domain-containing protein n=1 Tax=Paraburkholderia sp. J10-1 TaxID=2805430 RepID=UPI002AB6B47B|nr:FliM/FliN family flagellar motor C-terminal domain-containing protein [Paraburkholderia sp. J10-1]